VKLDEWQFEDLSDLFYHADDVVWRAKAMAGLAESLGDREIEKQCRLILHTARKIRDYAREILGDDFYDWR